MWVVLIGFLDTNDFVNVSICKCEFKFTCHSYCRFTLKELCHVPDWFGKQKVR